MLNNARKKIIYYILVWNSEIPPVGKDLLSRTPTIVCFKSKLTCEDKTAIQLEQDGVRIPPPPYFCFWHWQNIMSFTCMFGFPSTMSCLRFGRFFTKSMESILFSEMSSVSKVFRVTSGNVVRLLREKSRVLILFMCFSMSAGRSFRP